MKLSYTQRVLSRKASPALENENTEEVVDQAVIDAQPSEDIPVSDDVTVDETVVSEDPAEEVVEETTVEEPVATDVPVDGIEPIEPPQVVPVTDSGEATVDQVEAIAAGDPEAAAEVVAEVDNAEGGDTTAEEVIEEAEEVEAEAPAETDEVDVTPEATEELTETEEAPVDVADVTPEGEVPSSDEVVGDTEEVVEEVSSEDCACESDGTNPPNEGGTGAGEQHLPSEQVAVDEGKGEEVKPVQEKPVDEGTGESDIEVDQEKPAAEGKGEETLPCESEVVDEGKGENTHDGEIVSTERAEVVEEQVVDAPSENTPEEVAAVVEGEVPVVEEVVTETPAAEAPAEGVVEAVAEEPVDLSPESDDGDLVIEDFTTGTEDEEGILTEALDTYPQVVDVLEKSLDGKGVSVEAMMILNIFMKRDGNPLQSDVSLENYNFTSRTQTRLAVESIQEDMKSWAAQAIEFVKKAIGKIREFLHQRFNQVGILQRRADALKDVDMGIPGGQEVHGDFLQSVQVEGKIPDNWTRELDDFVNQYKQISKFRQAAAEASAKVVGAVKTDILDVLVKNSDKQVSVESVYEKAESLFKGIVQNGYFKAQNNSGFPSFKSPELIGDIQLEFLFGATGGDGAWNEPTFKVNKLDFEPVTTARSLSGREIHSVSLDVRSILSEVETKFFDEAYQSEITGSFDEMTRIGNLNDNTNGSHKAELAAVRKMLMASNRFAIEVVSTTTNVAIRVAKGAIEYAEASVKVKATA